MGSTLGSFDHRSLGTGWCWLGLGMGGGRVSNGNDIFEHIPAHCCRSLPGGLDLPRENKSVLPDNTKEESEGFF